MPSNINTAIPPASNPTTAGVRANFAAAKTEIEALQQSSMKGGALLTVGNGGYFADLKSALDWVAAQTPMVQVAGMTGTVTAAQNSNLMTGAGTNFSSIRPRDMIKVAGDGNGSTISTNVFHAVETVSSNTSLLMMEGFVGASGSLKTYEIWRPSVYTILAVAQLSTGNFVADILLPTGLDLTIASIGRQSFLMESGFIIQHPRCGSFTLRDFRLINPTAGARQFCGLNGAGEPIPVIAAGFTKTAIIGLHVDTAEGTAGNPIVMRGSSCKIENLTGRTFGGVCNVAADKLTIDNVDIDVGTGAADIIVCDGGSIGDAGSTHPWFVNNVKMHRTKAYTTGAGALLELQNCVNGKRMYANNLKIFDKDQPAVNPNALIFNGTATCKAYLENSIIRAVGLGKGIAVNNGIAAFTRNVHDGEGGLPVTATTGGSTISAF